ncbi:MAG: hypothetical protein AAF333_03265 [Planctomycetota bacterium]
MIDQSDLLRQAHEFLDSGDMDAIRIHEFNLDGDEHDDKAIDELHIDFKNDFDLAAEKLTHSLGMPTLSGTNDDDAIPMTGITHFHIWRTNDAGLFLAISHEDRGTPILLMLGGTID